MRKILKKWLSEFEDFDDIPLFLFILRISTYLFALISALSILFIFISKATSFPFRMFPNYDEFKRFIYLFYDFKFVYAATLSLIIAYLTIKRFVLTKKKEIELETFKLIDEFNNEIVNNVFKIYPYLNRLPHIPNLKEDNFSEKSIKRMEDKLDKLLNNRKNSHKRYQIVLVIGQLNLFAIKIVESNNINHELIKKAIGEIYCTIIESLISVIAYYMDKNNSEKEYYKPLKNLYFKWYKPVK